MTFRFQLVVLALIGCTTISFSQDILWEKSYGGKHAEYLFDVQPTADYGFLLAGSSISGKNGTKEEANKGDFDYWLWKMDEKGDLDWQKSFGGNGVDLLQSAKLSPDGGFILAGISNSKKGFDKKEDTKGSDDFWIIKLDAKGNELWQKTIGGSGQEKLAVVRLTSDGGYLLGGSSSSYQSETDDKGELDLFGKKEDTRGSLDYWLVKLTSDGSIAWQKTVGGQYVDELKDVILLSNGNILAGGSSNSPESGDKIVSSLGFDYWLVELDTKGDVVWQQTLGGAEDDQLFSLTATADGGFIVGGNSNSSTSSLKTKPSKNGSDFWVIKFDMEKNMQWQETYDYGEKDVLTSIIENADRTLLIGGYAQSEHTETGLKNRSLKSDKEGINDYIALKINAQGEELWTKTVGSKGEEVLKKLLETRDGGYLLAGTSNGKASRDKQSTKGSADFWVVKLKDKSKPEKERLPLEAFPNPTVTFTNVIIGYDYQFGTATLFDLNGRQLQQQNLKGERTLPFEFTSYPSGIYLISVKTNKEEHSVKIIKK